MDKEAVRDLISIRLQMLINLFGRKVNEEQLEGMKRVYSDTLDRMPAYAITGGFTKAERTCDRLPTPKVMRELCGECLQGGNNYDFREANGEDPETKAPIKIRIDAKTGERLYKAQDCPEGRTFLALLRQLGRKSA